LHLHLESVAEGFLVPNQDIMEIITCKSPVPQFAKKQLRNRKNLKQTS